MLQAFFREPWPFWLGGIALASVALLHWVAVGKLMSVSSRFTALVERARGAPDPRAEPLAEHLGFFGGLVGGGLGSALLAGSFAPSLFDVGDSFQRLFGASDVSAALTLIGGGVLVGIGTRMATGCTSGHGLCGVARFERGSLLATCAFFGTGVVVSMALEALA